MLNITIIRGGLLRENTGAYIRVMGTKTGLEKNGCRVNVCQPRIKYSLPFLRRIYWTSEVFLKSLAKKTDVYYGHSTIGGYIALFCAKLKGKKFLYDVHDINLSAFHSYTGLMKKASDFLENYVMKKADMIVVTCNAVKESIMYFGIPAEKIIIAPNGINLSDFQIEKSEIKKQKNKLIGILVGILIDWQVSPLFKVINKLFGDVEGLEIWFIGEGDAEKYKKMIDPMNMGKVKFFGPVVHSKIISLLAEGDFGFAPLERNATTEYAHPLKIVEYIASGLPVVSTDLRGSRDILGDKGLYIDENKPETIVSQVKKLQQESFRKGLSKDMLELSKEYDWKAIMEPVKHALDNIK